MVPAKTREGTAGLLSANAALAAGPALGAEMPVAVEEARSPVALLCATSRRGDATAVDDRLASAASPSDFAAAVSKYACACVSHVADACASSS